MLKLKLLLVLFYLLKHSFIEATIFQFIKDVYMSMNYRCVIVIVDSTDAIDHEARDMILKTDPMLVQIIEKRNTMNITPWQKTESSCSFFLMVEDVRSVLIKGNDNDKDIYKQNDWYILMDMRNMVDPGVQFGIDSNVFIVKLSTEIQISEFYQINGDAFFHSVGSWTRNGGLDWTLQDRLERRLDLNGITLRALFIPENGFLTISVNDTKQVMDARNINKTPWVGLIPDIFNSLARRLNFTYILSNPRDGKWGAVDENGEWNGIIKDLIDDEADIAAASLAVTQARSEAVDFLVPIKAEMSTFFVSRQGSSFSLDIFTKPYTYETWQALLILIVVAAILLYLIAWLGMEKHLTQFSFIRCFIYVYGAYGGFASRRWSVTPNNVSARIIFISVLAFGALNHWHWKASIISHLSVIRKAIPFSNLEELVTSPYQIATLGDSYLQAIWENSNLMSYQEVWRTKFQDKEKSLKATEQELVSQALSEQYAIYLFHTTLTNLPEYKSCQLQGTNFLLNKIDVAFPLRKDSPYLDLINHALWEMMESGELHRILLRHRVREPDCEHSGKGKPIGFENILLVFLILAAGLVISGSVCFLEIQRSKIGKVLVPQSLKFVIVLAISAAISVTLWYVL